jgi:transposase
MKLSKIAILALKGSKGSKKRIADALGVTESTVYRWIAENHDSLTKASSMLVIREITGLSDSEILEVEEPARA